VLARVAVGAGVASSVLDAVGKALGEVEADLMNTVNPEVVLAGGVGAQAGLLAAEITRIVCMRTQPGLGPYSRMFLGSSGPEAVDIGAARVALV